jgi:hypothetical protein
VLRAETVLAMPDHGDRAGERIVLRIGEQVGPGLARVARAAGTTLFAVVLAAWGSVVARFHDRDEVAVGCCTSGRHRPELAGVLGNLANTLVVPVPSAAGRSSAELVAVTRDRLVEALGDGDAPFETVFGALTGRAGVQDQDIRVRLTLDEDDGQALPPGCTGVADLDFGHAKSSLSLELTTEDAGVRGSLAYRPADVPRQRARELADLVERRLTELASGT